MSGVSQRPLAVSLGGRGRARHTSHVASASWQHTPVDAPAPAPPPVSGFAEGANAGGNGGATASAGQYSGELASGRLRPTPARPHAVHAHSAWWQNEVGA